MNKFLALLLLAVLGFSSCKKKQEDIIADIKKNTAKINDKLKDWTKRTVDDMAPRRSAKGVITGYFRDEEVKKIEFQQFTDSFRIFSEYYFDDGMLIYVWLHTYTYNAPITYTEEAALAKNDSNWYDDKKTVLHVSKFYFHKNKLIKWIDGSNDNEDVAVNTQEFKDRESGIWAEAVVLIKQLREE